MVQALIYLNNEVNTIYPDFAKKFDLWISEIIVGIKKINSLKLDIFDILIASFFIENKEEKSCFFKKTFLLADISIDITLRILFLILSNNKIEFAVCHLYLRTCIAAKRLLIIRWVELIEKKSL